MKLTKKDFERFKDVFMRYMWEFGKGVFTYKFKFEMKENEESIADVATDEKSCSVDATLYRNERDRMPYSIDKIAKHESIHVLLNPYITAVTTPGASPEWVLIAEEQLIEQLMKLIPDITELETKKPEIRSVG